MIDKHAVELMELMQLGKIEKRAIEPGGKFTSLVTRWFRCKPEKSAKYDTKEVVLVQSSAWYFQQELQQMVGPLE